MARQAHFGPRLFEFLNDLKAHNERAWFEANRARYETDVKEPLLRFINDVGSQLRKISRHVLADPRPVGGSMFRIYRDVRFSRDKSPYKTHAAAQFRHLAGKDVHAPGFYLHLEPGSVFIGAGVWHPDGESLAMIRRAIDLNRPAWKKVRDDWAFRRDWSPAGETVSRAPRGYASDHPLVEDLKRKDFICVRSFTQRQACSADFLDRSVRSCRTAAPFMRFLAKAVGMPF